MVPLPVCLVALAVAFGGCSAAAPGDTPGPSPSPTAGSPPPETVTPAEPRAARDTVFFPKLRPDPDRSYPEGLFGGPLVLDGRCLRVEWREGGTALVIWPPDHALSRRDGAIRVTNGEGASAAVGDTLFFGGGLSAEGGAPPPPSELESPVPVECGGPYLVTSGFSLTPPR